MKDVEKTKVDRKNSRKRLRRRTRKMNLYILVVLILALTTGITISYTFLFNITEIRVSGESDMYTAEEIVAASGINEGDNLLRLNTKKSAQKILDELLYVETAKVDRDFPSSLNITVTKCVPAYNIQYDKGMLLVSRRGKILADTDTVTEGLPIIYGYEPVNPQTGKPLETGNKHKNEAFTELMSAFEKIDYAGLATIDMSDEHSIIVNYTSGMIFKMGNWSDVEYKLSLADNVMNDESIKGKKGYLTMVGSNQCSFRMTDQPAEIHGVIEPSTEPATDANGQIIQGESNPEQEAIFSEYNNRGEDSNQNIDTDNYDDYVDYGYDDTVDYGDDYGYYDDEDSYYYDDGENSEYSEW